MRESNICPYLGLIADHSTFVTNPDRANACHQAKPPAWVVLDYQSSTCLQDSYKECPGYIHAWRDGFPKLIRRRNSIINPAWFEGLAWLMVAIPVILFIWAGFTGRLSFLSLEFPRAAIAPTSFSIFTRTPTETLTPTETSTPIAANTQTILLTETLTPTTKPDTPTPTQPRHTLDKPMVSVSVNTNCRIGPGLQYEYIGALLVGEQAEVVGVSWNGQFWVIKNPSQEGECWLWGGYARVIGDTSKLPRIFPPPR
jgi:hypothetical protein